MPRIDRMRALTFALYYVLWYRYRAPLRTRTKYGLHVCTPSSWLRAGPIMVIGEDRGFPSFDPRL